MDQDEIRRELFDYLQIELSKEKIDIKAREINHKRATRFLYRQHEIGIYRISDFYKNGIKFEVTCYFDDYRGDIHSYDTEPTLIYFMPEQIVTEIEKHNASYNKKIPKDLSFLPFFKKQDPRKKYITSQEDFAIKCLLAIKNKRNAYIEWLKYQALLYADISIKSIEEQ